jgi:hypothetical protein
LGQAIRLPLGGTGVEGQILAFRVAQLSQSLPYDL